MHHYGKPERQLVQAVNEAAFGVRNELESMRWGQSVEQCVAACLRVQGAKMNSGFKGVHMQVENNCIQYNS
jgi:hypothetical protein